MIQGSILPFAPRLTLPDNIVLLPLPPYAPELNPMENVWEFMRGNFLSHRVRDGDRTAGKPALMPDRPSTTRAQHAHRLVSQHDPDAHVTFVSNVGYARVSTIDQDPTLELDALAAALLR